MTIPKRSAAEATRAAPLPSGARLGVLTSGGDAPGMNAALRTAVKVGLSRGHRVLGVRSGYKGLLDGDVVELEHEDVDPIVRYGGTMLGSAREARFRTAEGRERAQRKIVELGLDGVLVIGGDGSLTGARVLSGLRTGRDEPLRVMGLPASIDNDIACTSMAIGVDTAVNTIMHAVDNIADTARAHDRTFIVEVMGRDCGYLAMVAAIASAADAVIYRESKRSHAEMLDHLTRVVREGYRPGVGARRGPKRMVLIIKAEGVSLPTLDIKAHLDRVLLPEIPTLETRISILGHVVRGGAPTALDRLLAARLANVAVLAMEQGRTGLMAGWQPVEQGEVTVDPRVQLFDFDTVLRETARLRDGTSEVAKSRVRMLSAAESVLSL